MPKLTFDKWFQEYKVDLIHLFKEMNSVLKSKKIYKEYSFYSFCKLIYSKSSKYG